MRSRAKSTPGVRYVCRSMNVRDLNRRAENQQQCTAKSKDDPPGASWCSFACLSCITLTITYLYTGRWRPGVRSKDRKRSIPPLDDIDLRKISLTVRRY